MFLKHNCQTRILWLLILLSLTNGCDDRATQIAREAADRQAQQNAAMAELNHEVASGTHGLVAADAQARREIVGVHRDLQDERTRLDTGWNALEDERRQVAGQRRTESALVAVTQLACGALLVAAVVGFCWYVLVAARSDAHTDAELNELLVREILSDGTPRLSADQRPPGLPSVAPPNVSDA